MITIGSDDLSKLTPKELQVMRCIGDGMSTVEIASRWYRSQKTIETHVLNINAKLGIAGMAHLRVVAALKFGSYEIEEKPAAPAAAKGELWCHPS